MAWIKRSSLLVLTLITAGCISESVTSSAASSGSLASSSESSSSPSKSSKKKQDSTENKTEQKSYMNDIANMTNSVTGSSITSADFMNALSRTASQDKISDWEAEPATFLGIGKGLKKASVPFEKIEEQPFLMEVIARNQNALSLIRQGFKE